MLDTHDSKEGWHKLKLVEAVLSGDKAAFQEQLSSSMSESRPSQQPSDNQPTRPNTRLRGGYKAKLPAKLWDAVSITVPMPEAPPSPDTPAAAASSTVMQVSASAAPALTASSSYEQPWKTLADRITAVEQAKTHASLQVQCFTD